MTDDEDRVKQLLSEISSELGPGRDCVLLVSGSDDGVKSFSPLSPAAVDGILHNYLDD